MKPLIIAEVAQAHDGNINIAHAFIDAVSKTGADAIKFQTHYADYETTKDEPWRKKFSWVDESRFEYWKRMEFTEQQWFSLAQHSAHAGLKFLSSPFSIKACDVLGMCGMRIWKIASGEMTNFPMIDDICQRKGEVILSCGIVDDHEVANAVQRIHQRGGKILSILECTTKYPTPFNEINISRMCLRGQKYNLPFGLSDHSSDIIPSICALVKGANVVEVHVTMHKDYFGPDNIASLTLDKLKSLVDARDKICSILSVSCDDENNRKRMRSIFCKSVYAAGDYPAGTRLELQHLLFLKPIAEIGAERYEEVVGKTLSRDVKKKSPLLWNDLK